MTTSDQAVQRRWKILFLFLEAIVLIPFVFMILSPQHKSSRWTSVFGVASCAGGYLPRQLAISADRKPFLPAFSARRCVVRLDARVWDFTLRGTGSSLMKSIWLNPADARSGAIHIYSMLGTLRRGVAECAG